MITAKIYAHGRDAPDKTAIFYNRRKISYRQFASLIESSRRYLAAQGVGGEGVAVLPTGSILNTWCLGLALRSLGLTTLVVSSRHNLRDLQLPDTRFVVAVAGEYRLGLEQLCADAGWRFIGVPADLYADDPEAVPPTVSEPLGRLGGYILLTSGTTGVYKKILIDAETEALRFVNRRTRNGVEISGRSVVNAVSFGGWTAVGYEGPTSTWDVGGTVVMHQGLHPWESFSHVRVTHVVVTPNILSEILLAPPGALRRSDALQLTVSGAPLSEVLYNAAKARLTSSIYTTLGSTEVGRWSSTPIRQINDLRWHRIAPERDVQIVDTDGNILPAGHEGLVRLRVLGGVTGYLHDETASRAAFRDGYFYPGDLGVIRADGRLSFRGRVTAVINIRGDKSAAAPIEELLQRKLGVTGVCVLSLQNSEAEEEIHVVIETPRPVEKARLAVALRGDLKEVRMSCVHFVETLPRNDMGKIQRDLVTTMISSVSHEHRPQTGFTK